MAKKNPLKMEITIPGNQLPLVPGKKIPVKITIRAWLEVDETRRLPGSEQ